MATIDAAREAARRRESRPLSPEALLDCERVAAKLDPFDRSLYRYVLTMLNGAYFQEEIFVSGPFFDDLRSELHENAWFDWVGDPTTDPELVTTLRIATTSGEVAIHSPAYPTDRKRRERDEAILRERDEARKALLHELTKLSSKASSAAQYYREEWE